MAHRLHAVFPKKHFNNLDLYNNMKKKQFEQFRNMVYLLNRNTNPEDLNL